MEIEYKIIEKVGILYEQNNGWNKEINFISWNNREPVYDIRSWSENHEKMGKGVILTKSELKKLKDILNEIEL